MDNTVRFIKIEPIDNGYVFTVVYDYMTEKMSFNNAKAAIYVFADLLGYLIESDPKEVEDYREFKVRKTNG